MATKKQEVSAEVTVLKHQQKFIDSKAPFPALIGGFGSGKTEALVYRSMDLIFKYGPMFKKHGFGQYVLGLYEPDYSLVKEILHTRLTQVLEKYKIDYVLNMASNTLTIDSLNTKILMRTMENPEKIVGYEICDAIIDELDTLAAEKAEEVFDRVLSRNRKKKPDGSANTLGVVTTPEGFGFVYKTWGLSKDPERYEIIRAKTTDNYSLHPSYIENMKGRYPAAKLRAYMNGEFVNFNGETVYSDFNRLTHNSKENIKDYKIIHIGMDFNVGKMSAVIGVVKKFKKNEKDEYGKPKKSECHIVDEIFGVLDTPAMIKEINKKFRGYNIYIYPDASGGNRKSVGASETDISLLREYFNVRVKSKNPLIKDRVMGVQSMFLSMDGVIRLFINQKCKVLMENLEQQIYDKFGSPDKKSGNDHMLDALGYLIYYIFKTRTSTRIINSPI